MANLVGWLDQAFFPEYAKNWDDQMFRDKIMPYLAQCATVLDLGAGAGIVQQMNFKGLVARVCGVDPDPRVERNPYLDEGKKGVGEQIPYTDNSFDVVFADNVLEHLSEPKRVFDEILRVLKPGGVFLAKTSNKFHYVLLIARCTPLAFHKWVNRLRGRHAEDTFPTRYLVNCEKDFRRVCQQSGFVPELVELHEGRPEYLRMTPFTYVFGIIYQRLVQSTVALRHFRVCMIGVARKPA